MSFQFNPEDGTGYNPAIIALELEQKRQLQLAEPRRRYAMSLSVRSAYGTLEGADLVKRARIIEEYLRNG